MKNYWQNSKAGTKNNLITTNISLLIVGAMLFQIFFPILALANTETDTASPEESVILTGDAISGSDLESEINTNVIDTESDESLEEEEADPALEAEEGENVEATETDPETASLNDETETTEETSKTEDKTAENEKSGSEQSSATTSVESASSSDPVEVITKPEDPDPTKTSGATMMTEIKSITPIEDESLEENQEEDDNGYATTTSTSSDIAIDNTATSTTNATGSASTGENTTTSDSGNFLIETGDAISYVDLVNVVNTNIVNSTGLIEFVRNVLGYENFDLRNMFNDIFEAYLTAESTSACGENVCDPSLLVDLANQAVINNDVTVIANTGGNTGTGGSGEIITGDAYASANIVNLANTNIVDSNYLLLVFDNFADMAGSLVLPNSDFFSSLFNAGHNTVDTVTTDSTATVNNNTETGANTGTNHATGSDTLIETGDATATSYVNNMVNQNLINSNSFSMLIRVHGDWSGDVFGLPEGMQWEETPDGIRLFYENSGSSAGAGSNINVTNDAIVNNNVKVFALTGDNQIDVENGGTIKTGNAYADTTAYNIINSNVFGSNWINLIFNIYGNWSGNIAFGQPDLWVGLNSKTEDGRLRAGDDLSYIYTVFNGGDTTAHDVILESEFPKKAFSEFDQGDGDREGYAKWPLGDIQPGETRELTITPRISREFGRHDRAPLPLAAKVSGLEPDGNPIDNEDSLLHYVGKNRSNKESFKKTFPAKFVIEKYADKDLAEGGDIVNYTVELTNRGGQIYDSLLVDTMVNEDGEVISEQSWPLETIKNDETITITYSIVLPEGMVSGVYTNTAQIIGTHGSQKVKNRTLYQSNVATHELTVGDLLEPEGEVLGISTDSGSEAFVCTPYLTTYLGQGKNNDPVEVIKLQKFLKAHSQAKVVVTGVFDYRTKRAVSSFQETHAGDILTPWGMTKGSGYVYYTTQKKINEIMCGDAIDFPLTFAQITEIENYKDGQSGSSEEDDSLIGLNTEILEVPIPEETDSIIAATTVLPRSTLTFTPKAIREARYSLVDTWIELFKNPLTALR